jgi:hypothetical protein
VRVVASNITRWPNISAIKLGSANGCVRCREHPEISLSEEQGAEKKLRTVGSGLMRRAPLDGSEPQE